MKAAADGPLKGILEYQTTRSSASTSSATATPRSSTRRSPWSRASWSRSSSWYDNEWGYSCRLVDLVAAASSDRRPATGRRAAHMKRSRDRLPARRQARARARRLQRAARGRPRRRRHAHPRGPADDRATCSTRAPGHPRVAPRPAQGAGRSTSCAGARWPRGSRSCSAARCATADDCVGPGGRAGAAALSAGRRAAAREPALPRARRRNDAGFARAARRRWATSTSTTPSAPRTAPTPRPRASRTTCPSVRRPAHEAGARGARPPAARPGAPVRGRARRRKVTDKIKRHRAHARASPTRCSSAAPWPTPSSPPRASRSARSKVRGRRGRRVAREVAASRPATRACELVAARDVVVADARPPPARRRASWPADASPPTRWRSTSARRRRRTSRTHRAARARSSGTARWASSRSTPFAAGTKAVGEAIAARRGRHRRRRRRHGAPPLRKFGLEDALDARLDGRRRVAWSSWRASSCPAWRPAWTDGRQHARRGAGRSWRATGRCTRRAPRRRRSCASFAAAGRRASDDREVVVCPPFTGLQTALPRRRLGNVVQGRRPEHALGDEGAFTGEVSPAMLVELGVPYVILGHSERRQYFGENDADAGEEGARRARRRPAADPLRGRDAGGARGRPDREQGRAASSTPAWPRSRRPRPRWSPIAYEPIWAIGTGKTATPEMAQETVAVHAAQRVRERFGDAADARAHPVRRQREARQHRRAHGAAGHRRRARRRRQPRRAGFARIVRFVEPA